MHGHDASTAADRAFLGLKITGDGAAAFELAPHLARPDGFLFGGTAMAAAVTMAEHVTGRPSLWTTVQFVAGSCQVGDQVELRAEVRAHGHRASQVRVEARAGGELIFDALGATALAKEGAPQAALTPAMPRTRPPATGEPWTLPLALSAPEARSRGFLERAEVRYAATEDPDEQRYLLWARVPERPLTPALLGFLCDWVPSSIVNALGRFGGGRSLDNTLRVGTLVPSEWLLVDFDPHLADRGFGHGAARLWAEDGTLLGVASQTSTLIAHDPA